MNSEALWRLCGSLTALIGLSLPTPADAQLRDRFIDACLNGHQRPAFAVTACTYALHGVESPASRATLLNASARAQLRTGRADAALDDADAALANNPYSAAAHDLRGIALQQLRRTDDAAAAFAEAIALAPFDADARVHRAALHFSLGAVDAAREDLHAALGFAPGHAEALVLSGLLEMHAGQFRAAAAHFRLAAEQSPVRLPYAAVWLGLATARDGGDMAAAIAPFAWWWDDGSWPQPIVDLIAGRTGPEPLAELLVDEGRLEPLQRIQAAYALAQWHLALNDRPTGLNWLRRVVALGDASIAEVAIAQTELAGHVE